jgi:hypothetical protein
MLTACNHAQGVSSTYAVINHRVGIVSAMAVPRGKHWMWLLLMQEMAARSMKQIRPTCVGSQTTWPCTPSTYTTQDQHPHGRTCIRRFTVQLRFPYGMLSHAPPLDRLSAALQQTHPPHFTELQTQPKNHGLLSFISNTITRHDHLQLSSWHTLI